MQRELPALGEPRKVKDVPMDLLKMCEDELDAVRLCIQLSGYTHEYIAKTLQIDKGHFSRIVSGSVGYPTHKRLKLMRMNGNYAPVQYECNELGLVPVPFAEYERLLKADEELKAVKAGSAAAEQQAKIGELESKCAALEAALAAMLTSSIKVAA
ncbi:hypothetical protein AB4Y43_01170 [Paraburkholderia sp. BR10872]|uniref:hypothetical protein n=1 Tax=Paraburkholderia sp. BR10872 TaxID=3236989 RepID=UPI0034D17B8D